MVDRCDPRRQRAFETDVLRYMTRESNADPVGCRCHGVEFLPRESRVDLQEIVAGRMLLLDHADRSCGA